MTAVYTMLMAIMMLLVMEATAAPYGHPPQTEWTAPVHHVSRYRRRLTAYISRGDGDDDDEGWLLMAAAGGVVAVTSVITVIALCTCCYPYSHQHKQHREAYIGQIDLEDIRVIYNRAVASPGGWSTSTDSGVVVNPRALDLQHSDWTVLNNQRVSAPYKTGVGHSSAVADAGDPGDAEMSDVLVENGRIVLQYRNVHAALRPGNHHSVHETVDRTRPGHVTRAPAEPDDGTKYDMNDVVWKNMAAH